jgi:hypothetical protein
MSPAHEIYWSYCAANHPEAVGLISGCNHSLNLANLRCQKSIENEMHHEISRKLFVYFSKERGKKRNEASLDLCL